MATPITPQAHNYHPRYRPDIDGMRAVAILAVILYHAFPAWFPGGFVGVDIFFVISGYLISSIIFKSLGNGDFSFAEFYGNRVRRIFPALLAILAACLLFGWFALFSDEYRQLGKHTAASAGFAQNFLLSREAGYFDFLSEHKPLLHLWSLAVEEQYYVLYPMLLWMLWRFRLNVFLVLLVITAASFALNIVRIDSRTIDTFFLLPTRFWELSAGGLLAYAALFKQETVARLVCLSGPPQIPAVAGRIGASLLAAAGLVLLASAVFLLSSKVRFPGWAAGLPVLGACFLILAGPSAWINRIVLSSRPMVFIGLISYPLYLWHWPLLAFARVIESQPLSDTQCVFLLGLSFLLAWMTYRFIENPIRHGARSWARIVSLALAMGCIGMIGYGVFKSAGLPGRIMAIPAEGDPFQWEEKDNATPACQEFVGSKRIGYCVRLGEAPPEVALIGDSHANSAYPGMAAEYGKHGVSLIQLGGAGCVPFYDTDSYQEGVESDSCRLQANEALEFATASGSVRTIVLSTYALRNMYGDIYGLPGLTPKKIRWERGLPEQSTDVVFAESLRSTLARLRQSGKRIVLYVDWPELGFDPKACLTSRPFRMTQAYRTPCAVAREAYETRSSGYRELVGRLRKEFPEVRIFDPASFLCDSEWCYGASREGILYRDTHHLSKAGSRYLGEKFVEQMLADK